MVLQAATAPLTRSKANKGPRRGSETQASLLDGSATKDEKERGRSVSRERGASKKERKSSAGSLASDAVPLLEPPHERCGDEPHAEGVDQRALFDCLRGPG